MESEEVRGLASRLSDNIKKVIVGREGTINLVIAALLCGGHVLIEDVPGTGKTMLAKALAGSAECGFKRIQFSPDLLPSDITGINYFNLKESEFEFVPGPAFTNILLADEINRATPKTQAGLLECMEERQVTIDGKTRALEKPFMVIATQNPVDTQGVFPLPEAQLDRFLIKISMGFPSRSEGVAILKRFRNSSPLEGITPAAVKAEIAAAQAAVAGVFVHEDLMDYIIRLAEATRENENVTLGVSPRGCLALMKVSQALAAMSGRGYVLPDDIKSSAVPSLAHRLMLKSSARISPGADIEVIREILNGTPVPTEDVKKWAGV